MEILLGTPQHPVSLVMPASQQIIIIFITETKIIILNYRYLPPMAFVGKRCLFG